MENTVMFIIGTIIFSLYMGGYMMMIQRQNRLQKLESEKNNLAQIKIDEIDSDGHGNWGRVTKPKNSRIKSFNKQ
jgi:hypothetical protein